MSGDDRKFNPVMDDLGGLGAKMPENGRQFRPETDDLGHKKKLDNMCLPPLFRKDLTTSMNNVNFRYKSRPWGHSGAVLGAHSRGFHADKWTFP